MINEARTSQDTLSRTAIAPEARSLGELEDAAGETKIELVQLPDNGNGAQLQLIEYSWGSGLGWYARKRLTLDADQAAGLASLLASTLQPSRPGRVANALPKPQSVDESGKVIRLFPAFDEA